MIRYNTLNKDKYNTTFNKGGDWLATISAPLIQTSKHIKNMKLTYRQNRTMKEVVRDTKRYLIDTYNNSTDDKERRQILHYIITSNHNVVSCYNKNPITQFIKLLRRYGYDDTFIDEVMIVLYKRLMKIL